MRAQRIDRILRKTTQDLESRSLYLTLGFLLCLCPSIDVAENELAFFLSLSHNLFRLLKQHRNRSYWCTDYDADGNWPVHFTCQMWICICDGKGLDRFTQMYCQISGTNENIGASTVLNRIDLSLSFLSSLITVISFSSHLRPFLKKQPEQIKKIKE